MNEIRIKNFKEIPYEELEDLNLDAKRRVVDGEDEGSLQERYLKYLADEHHLKAVTVCFSDLEGRFHMLDYDKKFLIRSPDNLTFDGSSIRGFSAQHQSDLRLAVDWGSFRWLPSDVFGPGKVMVFGLIRDRDGSDYGADLRSVLKRYDASLRAQQHATSVAPEIEGFLFEGTNAEQSFNSDAGFKFVSEGGYFHSLPTAPLKVFIDRFAEAQRALGFENEKDHPEVAPSQFELNYRYTDALVAADQIQLYKLLARQVAAAMGHTASFLPKPRISINGSGMHLNLSLAKAGRNLFHDAAGPGGISEFGWSFVDRILHSAEPLCLVLNSSVNAYRRLDPHYEAPNQIRASAVDRAAMIRIPIGNQHSARVEVRSVGPDANPYLAILGLLRTGIEGPYDAATAASRRDARSRVLPGNIQEALTRFESDEWIGQLMGVDNQRRYADLKHQAANRCPKELGARIKGGEILFHHEVTNQHLWAQF
ncbi:MAG: glutamine synthetase [Deltaproteobacteria bacterium]|nr:glutamine synthetase [Deltaproteobacteria bacterium]